jgi:hypothetical protein
MIRRALLLVSVVACGSSPPPPKPVAMEALPAHEAPAQKKMRILVNEAATIMGEAASVQAEPSGFVRVYADGGSFTLVGKQIGKTTLRFTDKEGGTQDILVEVAAGEPPTRALTIGETFVIPMKGVKEYSVGLPDIVATALTTDGKGLLVTGKKPGTTTILLIVTGGGTQSREVTVVGGKRQA